MLGLRYPHEQQRERALDRPYLKRSRGLGCTDGGTSHPRRETTEKAYTAAAAVLK